MAWAWMSKCDPGNEKPADKLTQCPCKKKARPKPHPLFDSSVTLCLFGEDLVPDSIHKRPQLPRTRRMTQFAQRLGFDLSDAFASHSERLAYFFQRVLAAIFQ